MQELLTWGYREEVYVEGGRGGDGSDCEMYVHLDYLGWLHILEKDKKEAA
jgi:hypothetical protein